MRTRTREGTLPCPLKRLGNFFGSRSFSLKMLASSSSGKPKVLFSFCSSFLLRAASSRAFTLRWCSSSAWSSPSVPSALWMNWPTCRTACCISSLWATFCTSSVWATFTFCARPRAWLFILSNWNPSASPPFSYVPSSPMRSASAAPSLARTAATPVELAAAAPLVSWAWYIAAAWSGSAAGPGSSSSPQPSVNLKAHFTKPKQSWWW
mmetsp:Transcript_99343/g.276581  ORF Transcript_99343/g.276581 Transcript_99343/m.276581 type:complete len:208 (-) Transcript_99343:166-789(-)